MTNEELVIQYKNGNGKSLTILMDRFKKKMKYLCFRYLNYAAWYGLDMDDLEQEGWIGFIKAIDSYEVRNDCSFFTFIKIPVTHSLLDAIRKHKPLGYKSKCHSESKYLIRSIDSPLRTSNGSEDMTLHDVIASVEDESKFEHDDYIFTLRQDLLSLLDAVFTKESKKVISEKEVLIFHYGLHGTPMTLAEIADNVNKTESYIGEIENQAIFKIRNSLPGKAFLHKYKDEHLLFLQNSKESIDLNKNPETVNMQLASINMLIEKYCD